MIRKTFLSAAVFILLLTGYGTQTYAASEELSAMLQDNWENYMTIEPNYDVDSVEYVSYFLDDEPMKLGFFYYRAFKFKTPPWEGKLIWSFINIKKDLENVVGWQILPAQGSMTGFIGMDFKKLKKDIPQIAPQGSEVLLQEIPPERLQPDQYYIIWFNCSDARPVKMAVSLNIVEDVHMTYHELFSGLVDF